MTILTRSLRREQVVVAIGMAIGLTLCFYATDLYMAALAAKGREFWSPALAWDFMFPLAPSWIWIYLLYFPICFLPLLFREIHEHIGTFRRAAVGFLAQFAAAFAFFWIAPSRMIRTPLEPSSLSEWALFAFYQVDQGFNIFPSLHVANVAFIACLTWRLRGRAAGAILWLLCLLIAVSTLFVKQHYLADLPAGVLLGAMCYGLAFSKIVDFLDADGSRIKPQAIAAPSPANGETNPESKRSVRRSLTPQLVFALVGVGLCLWLVRRIGWSATRASIAAIGVVPAIGLVLLYAFAQLSFCHGWYWTLGPWRKDLGLSGILLPFLAGDAVNCSVPSANAAGEPVKVAMLRGRVPMEDAAASVTLYKFSDFLSLALFLAFGLCASWFTVEMPALWYAGGGVVLFGMVGCAALLASLSRKGIFGSLIRRLGALLRSDRLLALEAQASGIDESIRSFWSRYPREFLLSLAFNFLGWFGGVIEAYLCLYLLNLPADWSYALAIETFALFINNVTFFVPARLGVVESSRALIFAALGLPAASGLAYGIVRRLRELAWIALGYAILSLFWPRSVARKYRVVRRPPIPGMEFGA